MATDAVSLKVLNLVEILSYKLHWIFGIDWIKQNFHLIDIEIEMPNKFCEFNFLSVKSVLDGIHGQVHILQVQKCTNSL